MFGHSVVTHPEVCGHLLGQLVAAVGADHVIWGTDSHLVGLAPMADRSVPALPDSGEPAAEVRVPANLRHGTGPDFRPERRRPVQYRREGSQQGDPRGCPEPDESRLPGGGRGTEPDPVRLGCSGLGDLATITGDLLADLYIPMAQQPCVPGLERLLVMTPACH